MKKRIDLIDRLKAALVDMKIDPNTATLKDIVQKCLTAEEGRGMEVQAITNVIYEDYPIETIYAEVEVKTAKDAPSRRNLMWQKKSEILKSLGTSFEELKQSFQEDKKYWDGGRFRGEVTVGPSRKEQLLRAFKNFDETLEAAGVWRIGKREFDRNYATKMIVSLINSWKAWKEGYGPEE